ncbi:MAG: methyltransferase domain-containing protein [Aquificae bacterium]|nr:methyltransferase domain-containing protein [Aquificota bacterium]
MPHKFDSAKIKKLDDPTRIELFDPREWFERLELKRGSVVLDVGTGAGFFLPFFSEAVGDEGKVIGIDVQREMVEYARENKVRKLSLKNTEVMLSDENRIPLPDESVDVAFILFTFHELSQPRSFLKELKRVLRKGGRVLVIDWTREEREKGPPPEEVYTLEELENFFREEKYRVIFSGKDRPFTYALLAQKTQ